MVDFKDAPARYGRVRLPALLACALLVGCVDTPDAQPSPEPTASTPIDLDGERALTHLEAIAKGHPRRNGAYPAELEAARTFLEGALTDAGVEAARAEYSPSGTNVLGFIRGTARPQEWVVLSCHYDTQDNTIEGARDDAIGCAALLELAAGFAIRPLSRTLVFAFFDEEEKGLIGSRAFVEEHLADPDIKLAANINLDPAGLHWPCGDAAGPYPVRLFITEDKIGPVPGYAELLESVRNGLAEAEVPDELVEVGTRYAYVRAGESEFLPPGSDDDSFDASDIPSVWMGAPPRDEVGPIGVWSYPNHTPADTVESLYARCGDRATMGEGLRVSMVATAHALVAFDAYGP